MMPNKVPSKSIQNLSKIRFALIGFIVGITLLFVAGCNQLTPKPPPIEAIYTSTTDIAFGLDLKNQTFEDESLQMKIQKAIPRLNKILTTEASGILKEFQLQAEDLIKIGGVLTGLEAITLDPNNLNDVDVDWLVVADFKQFIPSSILVKKLNESEEWQLHAIEGEKINGFQFITITDKSKNELLEIAVFPGQLSQIRAGSPATLRNSILSPSEPIEGGFKEAMKEDKHQLWLNVQIPETVKNEIKSIESALPFDPGTLVGGFSSIMMSNSFSPEKLDTTFAFEFEDAEQANIAFSYLQVALTFALKPYAKKQTSGEAKKFIKSIRNRSDENIVKLKCSIYANEIHALSKLHQNEYVDRTLEFVLDLIQTRE